MSALNYRHLHYFWVVAKEGGFARAADRLGMAVQTISAQVRELERSLGHQLLKPEGRGLVLTEAGQATAAARTSEFQSAATAVLGICEPFPPPILSIFPDQRTIEITDATVTIFEDYRLVATHPRGRKVGQRFTVSAHLPPEAQAFFLQDRAWCARQAAAVGPACAEFVSQLLADRIVERLRAAQGLLRLAKTYGPERLEAACARALHHATIQFRSVKHILMGGHDALPLPQSAERSSAYASAARFARDAQSLFDTDEKLAH